MSRAKILIVEDEAAIAVDIAMNLEANGFEVVAVLHNGDEVEEVLKTKKIDLVMLDINIEGTKSGIDLGAIVGKEYGLPFIYLTSYADKDTVSQAAETFPASYLVKPFKEHDLAPAIAMALAKKNGASKNQPPSLRRINQKLLSLITESEYSVICKLWEGQSNLDIADTLFISKNTVKTHIRNIYMKLQVHSKPELIKYLQNV